MLLLDSSLSPIPLNLIKLLNKRKFFYNHPELLPNNSMQIGIDGFWIHKYDHPHSSNKDGSNDCPYCLPSTRKDEWTSKHTKNQWQASWFNHAEVGDDVFTNVLRYQEVLLDQSGASRSGYRGAWICSEKINSEKCLHMAATGRMRWNHEDVHNTAKNRGFDMKHDMARSDPHPLFVWKLINFIAYVVSDFKVAPNCTWQTWL
jgi:hypothetical protein